jgi:phosphomannomutase
MMLLELLATERAPVNTLLRRLEKQFGPHHYARLDTHFPLQKRAALMEYCKSHPPPKLAGSPLAEVKSYDGVKFVAADGAWLMLRGSGTEPIPRIYAEAKSESAARKLIRDGVAFTQQLTG